MRVAEEPAHHVALAPRVDMRDLGLLLERRAHQRRQLGVELRDLLELVEVEDDALALLRRDRARQLEEVLERVVDVGLGARSREAEARRAVQVHGDRRRDSQRREDPQSLARLEERGRDVVVDRLGELARELLLRRRRHEVDLDDENPLPDQLAERRPDGRRLPVAARRDDRDVLAVADVRLELGELGLAVGEGLVGDEIAVVEGVPVSLGHPLTIQNGIRISSQSGVIQFGVTQRRVRASAAASGRRRRRSSPTSRAGASCARARRRPAASPASRGRASRTAARPSSRRARRTRPDRPDEHPALAARGDRHVAADEEREAAEHLLLGEARLAGHELADPFGERLVVRHGAILVRQERHDEARVPAEQHGALDRLRAEALADLVERGVERVAARSNGARAARRGRRRDSRP